MAEIDDLKTSVNNLTIATTDLNTAVGDVTGELKNVSAALLALVGKGTINPADVEALAQQVGTLAANLETAKANLETATSDAKTATGV